MIVVSDSSPLISLHAIGRLDLLRSVFGKVLVPDMVRAEVERGGPAGLSLAAIDWIEVRAVSDLVLLAEFERTSLDAGEAAALALAIELHADFLLVDERAARRDRKAHV